MGNLFSHEVQSCRKPSGFSKISNTVAGQIFLSQQDDEAASIRYVKPLNQAGNPLVAPSLAAHH